MKPKLINLDFKDTRAEVFCFDCGTDVCEYHAMLHVSDQRLPYAKQLEAIMNAYQTLLDKLPGTQAVFKRYFLSDAANQAYHTAGPARRHEDCPVGLSHDQRSDGHDQQRSL